MVKVLIVEDDPDLRGTMVDCLRLAGLDPRGVGSAEEAYKALAAESRQVAVIDVGLPGEDGLSIARTLRGRADLGLIILTARSSLKDRLAGFDAGADAYFVKPVDCRELALAVVNLGRRIEQAVHGSTDRGAPARGWTLDREGWALEPPRGPDIPLTAKEMALIERLMQGRGQAVPRGDLISALGYRHDELAERKLDAVVGRLRRKIESHSGEGFPIKTVHAVGYVFSAPLALAAGGSQPLVTPVAG